MIKSSLLDEVWRQIGLARLTTQKLKRTGLPEQGTIKHDLTCESSRAGITSNIFGLFLVRVSHIVVGQLTCYSEHRILKTNNLIIFSVTALVSNWPGQFNLIFDRKNYTSSHCKNIELFLFTISQICFHTSALVLVEEQ